MHLYRPSVHYPLQSNNPYDASSSSAWDTRPRLFGPSLISLILLHLPASSCLFTDILQPEGAHHNSARIHTSSSVILQSPKRSQYTLPTIPLYRRFCGVKPTQRPDSDVSLTQHKSADGRVREHTRVDTHAARANERFSPASPAIVKDAT